MPLASFFDLLERALEIFQLHDALPEEIVSALDDVSGGPNAGREPNEQTAAL